MVDTKEKVIQPPPWMNQEYLQKSLRSGLSLSDLQVTECAIQPAVAVGDNYASQLFRVKLKLKQNGSNKDMSVVVKMLPESETFKKMLIKYNFFEIEIRMLTTTLPDLQHILDKIIPSTVEKPFADCLYHQGAPEDLLILSDLREDGYRLANRHYGLDLDHSLLAIKTLARLHAASLQLIKMKPDVAKQYEPCIWDESNRESATLFLQGGALALGEELQTWDLPKKYSQKMIALDKVFVDRVIETYKRDDSELNVILHGDTWVNNMMFRYSGEKVVSIKYLDFQLANLNSPVLDLNYFIFTSIQREVREKHLELVLQTYHSTFMEILQLLNYDLTYSFEDLKKTFYDKMFSGLFAAIFILPIICAPKEDALNIDEMLTDSTEFSNKQIFKSDHFKAAFNGLLPFFEKHGIF